MSALSATVAAMNQPSEQPPVWLYDGHAWRLTADPVRWDADLDEFEEYREAGYRAGVAVAHPRASLDQDGAGLRLWTREKQPQCMITIEWSGEVWNVYAARLPDGLDVMAKWAPIFAHASPPVKPQAWRVPAP